MCSIDIDKSIAIHRGTKQYRGIHDTGIMNFWYRDTSWYRQYRPALNPTRSPDTPRRTLHYTTENRCFSVAFSVAASAA